MQIYSLSPVLFAFVHILISQGKGIWFVHATSAGDAYGQRVEMRRVGDGREGERGGGGEDTRSGSFLGKKAVLATPRSALLADRIQSM